MKLTDSLQFGSSSHANTLWLDTSTAALTIREVQLTDDGAYTCTTDGGSNFHTVQLHVDGKLLYFNCNGFYYWLVYFLSF